jgi:hypothetical protein
LQGEEYRVSQEIMIEQNDSTLRWQIHRWLTRPSSSLRDHKHLTNSDIAPMKPDCLNKCALIYIAEDISKHRSGLASATVLFIFK